MPVSRRAFLVSSAGAAAAAAAGAGATVGAGRGNASPLTSFKRGIRWPEGQVFPTFARPANLHVADVHGKPGDDVTLLTTLQGIVNRERPEIYLEFDPVDHTWLGDLGVSSSRDADPLELVQLFKQRVRGAIVTDPDVPDSVNVATTLAGLTGSVVATSAQAKEHGLPVVQDLRGKFEDDRVAVYRWQLENLWPRCSHRMVAGLPPTQVVAVPGVTWTEVGRETTQLRDGSNEATYTFDLTSGLGGEAVYLKFADAFGDDGWGSSMDQLTLKADGTTIASFAPDTAEEAKYLFDGEHSQVGGDGNRFADGGNYFTYKFDPPAGTAKLTVEVHLWNQYLVSVTDASPTKHESFPNFRDFVVATKSMVSWLPPSGESGDLLAEIFAKAAPGTPYAGWFANDVSGEWDGVELAAGHGVEVVAADYYMNGTVTAGVPAQTYARPSRRTTDKPKKTTYLTLTFGEGDNIQFCQRRLRDLWDNTDRGKAPMNWTVSPLLADIGPKLLNHFQRTATKNDLLVCGPSGAGYTYPDSWPQSELDVYTKLSGRYMEATGMDVVYAYSTRGDDRWQVLPTRVIESYDEHAALRGIIQTDEKGTISKPDAAVPVIGNLSPAGKAADYKAALLDYIESAGGDRPLFIAGAINAWSWSPSDVVELVKSLPDSITVVLADRFFDLFAQS